MLHRSQPSGTPGPASVVGAKSGGKVLGERIWASFSLVEKKWFLVSQCLYLLNVMVRDSLYKINILCPLQIYLYLTYRLEVPVIL